MFKTILQLLNLLISLFKSLTPKQKQQIIDVFVDLFQNIFKTKRASKESNVDSTTVKEATNDITEVQWGSSITTVSSLLPKSFTEINKKKFTDAMIKLVQSDEFLEKLDARIDKIDIQDEDLYTEQCSLEMRKLIAEMVREKNL